MPASAARLRLCIAALMTTASMAMAAEWATVEIDNGVKTTLRVEIADTRAERMKGLSNRKEPLEKDAGMLFVFNPPQSVCLWMKDTHIPLAAAFIRADGRITKTAAMQPRTTRTHCAEAESAYVLETAAPLLGDVLTVGATVRILASP